MTYLAETDSDLALAPLQSAACTDRIALGPRAGQKVLTLKTVPTQAVQSTTERCATHHGFSLHADVHCGGKLKIIAAIEEPGVIAKILSHLGLPTRHLRYAPALRNPASLAYQPKPSMA